jgi:hypothetical protein
MARLHRVRGILRANQGMYQGGLLDLQKAVELNPAWKADLSDLIEMCKQQLEGPPGDR